MFTHNTLLSYGILLFFYPYNDVKDGLYYNALNKKSSPKTFNPENKNRPATGGFGLTIFIDFFSVTNFQNSYFIIFCVKNNPVIAYAKPIISESVIF